MLSRFNRFFLTRASGRTVLLWLFIAIASFSLMAAVITPAFQDATEGLRPFDLNFGISAEVIYRDLPVYTDRSRTLYIGFAIADYIYPAAAAVFFIMLWVWMSNKSPNRFFERLTAAGVLVIPLLFALVDWLENAGFLFVIFSYPTEYPRIANMAGTLKKTKPFIEMIVLALTIVFTATALWHSSRRKH